MKITNKVTIDKDIDINVGDVFYNKETDEIALITSIGDGYSIEGITLGLFFFNANKYEDLTEGYILDPCWVKVSAEITIGDKHHKTKFEVVQYDGTQDTIFEHSIIKVADSHDDYDYLTLGKDDPVGYVQGYYIKPSEWVYKEDGRIMPPITNEEFANKFAEFFEEGED
ncbi:hypothetical protein HWC08_gp061 [Lactobacillus phage 521B]|uniref:Uncharacterized protein n=1 Tax=Lactobacillus phage 521B TaxID=2510942 RepID=A0A4Y5FEE3_9CAUD|nr:hypothetical protein HWC08_gp061 [Lactobacillus phage 521B]QBJ03411.1 hypothetical protein B521_0061 [Lactobacillus phage 521B]